MKISICVLTYNRSSLLKNLLLSIQNLKYDPMEIIVIDNCSEDNTQQMMRDEFPYVNYIRTNNNIGASARNFGLKSSTGDIIITLDDDLIGIDDTHIMQLIRLFSGTPQLGAVNFKIIDHSTGQVCNWVHHCKYEEYGNKEFLTYEITEGAVAFRKAALEKSGYYPENFFLSHEGPDLAFRIMSCGYDVIYTNLVCVEHCHSGSGRKDWYNYYFDTRNQLWLAARNFPFPYSVTYLLRGLSSILFYSIRDGYCLYWIKAVKDGLKGLKTVLRNRNVLNKNTMELIRRIDANRPNLLYLFKKKGFKARDSFITSQGNYYVNWLPAWFTDYYENHPHKPLKMRSPRKYRESLSVFKGCLVSWG